MVIPLELKLGFSLQLHAPNMFEKSTRAVGQEVGYGRLLQNPTKLLDRLHPLPPMRTAVNPIPFNQSELLLAAQTERWGLHVYLCPCLLICSPLFLTSLTVFLFISSYKILITELNATISVSSASALAATEKR